MAANNKYEQLSQWIIDLMDDSCSEQDFQQFQELISSKPEYMRYYVEFVSMYSLLDRRDPSVEKTTNLQPEEAAIAMLEIMAEQEIEATPIKEVDNTGTTKSSKRETHVTRKNLKSYFFGIAAFMLICFGVIWLDRQIVNYHATNILPKLAKISSQIDGDLRHKGEILHEGQWLWPGEYSLKAGFMELTFENGTTVVMESPVDFSLKSQDKMYLKFGRLYANVPPQAVGFTIDSKSSKVVDLGTQFGMMVNVNGDTNLHVYKGKTALFSGNNTAYNFEQTISEGQARALDSASGNIKQITINNNAFARSINSETKYIWYGDININLADIVGGGSGFGNGKNNMGINPVSGERGTGFPEDRRVNGKYAAVESHSYIDGTFVPVGPCQQISSTGLTFENCPETNTNYYINIVNGSGSMSWQLGDLVHTKLGTRPIGTYEYPCILMHANVGITFDLQKIRDDLAKANLSFDRFTADTGFTSAGDLEEKGKADVYVLIDGEVRFKQVGMDNCESVYNVDVELNENDRFLTLISTDGGDPDNDLIATWADWCAFAKPELILTLK